MSYVIYEGGWPFCYEMSRRGVGGGGKKRSNLGYVINEQPPSCYTLRDRKIKFEIKTSN